MGLLLLSHFSRVQLCVTPWTTAYQAPPSMGFSRQEYWSGVPLPSPEEEYSSLINCSWGGRSDLRWEVAEGSPIANMAASNSSQAVGLWWGTRVFSQIT